MTEGTQRKLAAILAADVVGYSRLMGEDEAGTLAALRQLRSGLLEPTVAKHRGQIVKNMGDGWLIAFDSAADGVCCAIETQEKLSGQDALSLRMGLHIGDVTHADDDVFGDGVNIASRLQEIAEPGAIVISDTARRSIDGRLATGLNDLGQLELKNIHEPVAAFGWGMSAVTGGATALPLPDKLSIAVLPFDNLSGDLEQEFFADGITEDIITALSRIRQFFVVARNTTFQYKGQALDVRSIAQELGVRYVLQGSVRIAGTRARISAQLIDGDSGSNVWGEQFDHQLDDVFAVQDAITQAVVGNLGAQLSRTEQERALSKPPENLDAWELHYRGMFHLYKRTVADNKQARFFFEKAIDRDPNFSSPYAATARTYAVDWAVLGILEGGPEQALKVAKRAVELDPQDAFNHLALGLVYWMVSKDTEAALQAFMEAHRINPNDVQIIQGIGGVNLGAGRAEAALPYLEQSIELGHSEAMVGIFYAHMAFARLFLREHEEAVVWAKRAIERNVPPIEWTPLTAALAHLGREKECQKARAELEAVWPGITLDGVRVRSLVVDPAYLGHLLSGLREAGVPN